MDQAQIEAHVTKEYPLFFLEMNEAQERFIRAKNRHGKTPRRRLSELGNKCLTYNSLIETPGGEVSIGELFTRGEPFDVYSWDGERKVIARASAPFKKPGVHKCYRITMSDGRSLDAADEHFFLTSAGWQSVQSLFECFQVLQGPNKVSDKIIDVIPISELQEVFDFTVEKYHTYFAGGLIHHNSGKTHVGLAEDIAHSLGARIWLSEDDPDYKIEVKIPNKGLIGCETLSHSVPEKIWPVLKSLIPKTCRYTAKKNPQGVIQHITIHTDHEGKKCGSEMFIRSYDQNADDFEGIDVDWAHWDEPPPKPILQAAERGKTVTNAPSWFTMTPLKEAYIYDEYSLKAANNGGDDDEIAVMRGEIWENCIDWCFKCGLDIPENKEMDEGYNLVRPVKNCPNCNRIMGFIPKAGIDEYLKTLDPEERESREKGLWKHLSGLVYKVLDRDVHQYDDFAVPRDWMKIEGIDPHDARATCYLFTAVSPEEVEIFDKTRNRLYVYDYLLLKDMDLDTMVRKIRMKREEHGYSKPKMVVMDAKYGAREEMEGKCWEDEMRKRGLGYIRLSQSKPGDVELGHKIVREYLKPHHSVLTDESKPGLMLARDGCRGTGGPMHHLFNYQYNPKNDKPLEDFKDFSDIVRYICMEQPTYISPASEKKVIDLIMKRKERAYSVRRRGTM